MLSISSRHSTCIAKLHMQMCKAHSDRVITTGRVGSDGRRADALAAATLPNGATHCGAYAADVRSGPGIYLFAAGGGYVGSFSGGRRSGMGAP